MAGSPWREKWLGWAQVVPPDLLLVLAITAFIHRGAVSTGFALDDITYLRRALEHAQPPGLFRLFGAEGFFRVLHPVFGLQPMGYHVVALLLHVLNTAGIYLLGRTLPLPRLVLAAVALVFGCSAIAFTPLRWISAVSDILAGTFLLLTVSVVFSARSWTPLRFVAALTAFAAAVMAKEAAIAWPAMALCAVWILPARSLHVTRHVMVAGVLSLFAVILLIGTQRFDTASTGAYALSMAPRSLLHVLSTYALWCLEFWRAFPDMPATVAEVNTPILLAGLVLLVTGLSVAPPAIRRVALLGLAWWCCFTLPTLPLPEHLYRYYLYVPWIGGSLAVTALASGLCMRLPRQLAHAAGVALMAVYVAGSVFAIETRERSRSHALPLDPTLRSAELLRNAVNGLRQAQLPPGSAIGFVNPVPASNVLMFESSSDDGAPSHRRSYRPLEAALGSGEAISVFVPELRYQGFSDTIPATWDRVECFYYEQRGHLRHWGTGAEALEQQLGVQLSAGRTFEAERTSARLQKLHSSARPGQAP